MGFSVLVRVVSLVEPSTREIRPAWEFFQVLSTCGNPTRLGFSSFQYMVKMDSPFKARPDVPFMFLSCYGNSEAISERAMSEFHRIHTALFDE